MRTILREHMPGHSPEQLHRVPQPEPFSEAGGSGKEPGYYFARFLRKAHPEYDEETIKRKVQEALGDEGAKSFLEPFEKFNEEIDKHPDWIEAMRKIDPDHPLLPD